MRRNLTRAEREMVAKIAPRLNTRNWVIRKKTDEYLVLQHKETGTKKVIPV
ncbi:hypothetical protein J2S00_003059 [Caldalkalibacillus uzonensis]|uniref:DUF6906 domain-containing protein n=1 Tax=Caldalkalibacillus uzonensis TaxID=353224 RepID=A0ABU0CUZ6_9BACI|nr:hypothetical protein [Caldalkalibacillus uzonensis]MDQ0340254.1 hypothetical protein [Caldalkalibacillus uzonensis]